MRFFYIAKAKSYTVKHFWQNGIPQTQVYHVIEYAEATESVDHRKGVGTPQNLTKPQREKQKAKISTTLAAGQYDTFQWINVQFVHEWFFLLV